MGMPDHLTCLLRNLSAGQEATVRTRHGTMDWFQIGKGVRQGCILSPYLFNLCAGYIIRNIRLDEAQAGIKIAGRNINNLRYADDITLMTESEEELKSLLIEVKEESEKAGLKLNIQGLPWWPNGWDSALPLQRAWVWFLVRELRSHILRCGKKKKKIKKTKIMTSSPITSWQTHGETMETVTEFIHFLGFQNHCRWWLEPWN